MSTVSHVQSSSGGDVPRAGEGELPQGAYTLLAQANLLRMRGHWPEAIEKCMTALKLSPDNASAQSLLGDIYENQGLLDDAVQWYRMALDVHPDSPADKMKLARVIETKSRTLPPGASRSAPRDDAPALPPAPDPHPLAERIRANPDALLRRTAYGAGALALLVILLALGSSRWSSRLGKSDRTLDVPNVNVVMPAIAAVPSGAGGPAAPAPTPTAPPSDPAEQDLLAALRGAPNMAVLGVTFVDVESDPRAGRLTLRITCQAPTPGRDGLLRDALRAAQAAVQVTAPQAYSQFTVRCLAAPPAGGGGTPLLLMTDATRAAVTALPSDVSSLPSGQILAAFSNLWWSSTVPQ